jgi:hypothetical protein
MPSQEKWEIIRHAAVGGAIGFVLLASEKVRDWADPLYHWLRPQGPNLPTWLINVGLGVLVFFLAFGLIILIEARSHRKEAIQINHVQRDVNGYWITAVIHDGEVVGTSWLKIDSSRASESFTIEGETYRVERNSLTGKLQANFDSSDTHGSFGSRFGHLFGEDGISYPFIGKRYFWKSKDGKRYDSKQPNTQRDQADRLGVVYYEFRKAENPDDKSLFLTGAFLTREENSISHVVGTWVGCEDKNAFSKRALINAWLEDREVQEFQVACSDKFQTDLIRLVERQDNMHSKIRAVLDGAGRTPLSDGTKRLTTSTQQNPTK